MPKSVGMSKDAIEKKATKGPSLWQYKPGKREMDDAELAVDFLYWASQKFPKRPVPTTHIVRVALNRGTLPKEDTEVVETFRKNRMSRVKQLAIKLHNKPVVPVPGMGWRMAVDDDDMLSTDVERTNRRLISSIRSHDQALGRVKKTKLRSQKAKSRYDELSSANKTLMGGVLDKLLPEDAESVKKKG